MTDKDYKIIKCPRCGIPFVKVYDDDKQSFLKWHDGRRHETFFKGMKEIKCFACSKIIKVDSLTQLSPKL